MTGLLCPAVRDRESNRIQEMVMTRKASTIRPGTVQKIINPLTAGSLRRQKSQFTGPMICTKKSALKTPWSTGMATRSPSRRARMWKLRSKPTRGRPHPKSSIHAECASLQRPSFTANGEAVDCSLSTCSSIWTFMLSGVVALFGPQSLSVDGNFLKP